MHIDVDDLSRSEVHALLEEHLTNMYELSPPESVHALDVDGLGATCFCHATPRDDEEIFTERDSDAIVATMLEETDAATIVCGHTHVQFDRRLAHRRVVNAGSVGMSFDTGHGARWAMLGPDVPVITCLAREKPRYAAPGHVLVDDRETAREGWERNGGIFIHHRDAAHSIAALKALGFAGA